MKNQITIIEAREVIKTTRNIAPILNRDEMVELVTFYNRVLDRYEKEEYPDGLPEEEEE
ncbi:hypothetical protein P7G51_06145 [Enterococcus asini]|uniref:hypothetical protein n=1 Tax=Enterococcus asini TaxID=57732 RepID=UPI00288F624B|nr:hypothetical protein [Enterococcus asini]MDT2756957.1 hypothetical protein [Enterococcus asini]